LLTQISPACNVVLKIFGPDIDIAIYLAVVVVLLLVGAILFKKA